MITGLCLSFLDRSKVRHDAWSAWMTPYHLSLKARKVVYLGNGWFLVKGHRYQSKKFYNFFYGKPELQSSRVKQDGHYVFEMIRTIQITYGRWQEMGRRGIEIRHLSMAYHLRNSPSSTNTCRIGGSWGPSCNRWYAHKEECLWYTIVLLPRKL
jgi:hypothetical protein